MRIVKKIMTLILVVMTFSISLPKIHYAQDVHSELKKYSNSRIRESKVEIRSSAETLIKEEDEKKSRWWQLLIVLAAIGGAAAAILSQPDSGGDDSRAEEPPDEGGSGTVSW